MIFSKNLYFFYYAILMCFVFLGTNNACEIYKNLCQVDEKEFKVFLESVQEKDLKYIPFDQYKVVFVVEKNFSYYEITGLPKEKSFLLFSYMNEKYRLIQNEDELFEVAGEKHVENRDLCMILNPHTKLMFRRLPIFKRSE